MQDKRIETLMQMLSGDKTADEKQVKDKMEKSLSAEQQALFKKALSDRETAQQLLNTPQAVELLKKLQKNGGRNGP